MNPKPWSLLALGVSLITLAPARVASQDAASIIRRAGAVYRGLSSLQADFVQVIQDATLGDTVTAKGKLYQAGANAFAMRFSDPPDEAIVIDGTYVWFYTPSTAPGQVIRMRMETDPVYGANLLARILDRPAERYQSSWLRTDTVEGRRVEVVAIVPRSTNMNFSGAVLWLERENWLPLRIELDESPGVRRILTLSHLRPNAAIPRAQFEFTVPPGVRVINQ